MRKNPFLRAERTVIRKVWGNKSTLNLIVNVKDYDGFSGSMSAETFVFPRSIYLKSPTGVSDFLVDGKNFIAGDVKAEAAMLDIQLAMQPMAEDPEIVIDGESKTIEDFRSPNNRTGGIDLATDEVIFNGTTYRIIDIQPTRFYAGTPTRVKFHLRGK